MEQTAPHCAICATQQQLKWCTKCKSIYYCSTAHQHADWPQHKRNCRQIARQKEEATTLNLNQVHNSTEQLTSSNSDQPIFKHPAQLASPPSRPYSTEAMSLTMEQMHMSGAAGNISSSNSLNANTTPTWPLDDLRSSRGSNLNIEEQHNPHHTQHTLQSEEQLQSEESLQSQQQHQQQQFIFYNNQNGQSDRNNSYQIGQGNENAIGYTNERRYDELCRNIINDMNQYGLSVVDDFLGNDKGLEVLHEVHRMYSAGVFKDGQLANTSKTDKDLRKIRGDKITWVKGVEPGCANVGYLINQIDAVICRANTMKNNGILGDYNIKERTKAMVACYPGSGSHYVMHVDNPNKDGRVITAIYYLNVDWDTKRSGGVLRIFPEHGNSIADIEPKFDRLIFFWSDKRNPHEVQPAHRTRYAITVWYFDANEREAALNRCKYQNHLNNPTPSPPTNTTTQQQQQQQQQQSDNSATSNNLKKILTEASQHSSAHAMKFKIQTSYNRPHIFICDFGDEQIDLNSFKNGKLTFVEPKANSEGTATSWSLKLNNTEYRLPKPECSKSIYAFREVDKKKLQVMPVTTVYKIKNENIIKRMDVDSDADNSGDDNDGIKEKLSLPDSLRAYLSATPRTSTAILQHFCQQNKKVSSKEMQNYLNRVCQEIKPQATGIDGKIYFFVE